jgi:hypothetical protein
MFKTSLEEGTILWVGKTDRPRMNHYQLGTNEGVHYVIKLTSPLARTTGHYFNDPACIPFLQAMGIKVTEHTNITGTSYRAIGCHYEEIRGRHWTPDMRVVPQVVQDFYAHVKGLTNAQFDSLLTPFDEPSWTLGTIRDGIGTEVPEPEGEGWIAI